MKKLNKYIFIYKIWPVAQKIENYNNEFRTLNPANETIVKIE